MAADSSEDDGIAPTEVAQARTMVAEARTMPASRESRPIDTFRSGTTIGRYVLQTRLGAGAMGVVWSAHDPKLDREVAIKLVHAELARSQHAATRLLREARAMAKLSHRSVVVVHDAGDVEGQLFITMELVRGTTLGHLLRTREPAAIEDWPRWLAMMLDAGRGLAEAHRNGVLHRDFKPDNVLVDNAGRVCVSDFGLAMLGDRVEPSQEPVATAAVALDGTSGNFDLTTTGAVLGTPLYMSPQQLNGEAVDARADQFAYCVALHEALYGARPFTTTAQGLAAIPGLVDEIKRGLPDPPADSPVPQAIHDVIRRGLSVSPDDRWPDMDALIAALERAGKRRGTTVMRPTRPRWIPVAIAAVVCAAVAVVAIVALRGPESAPALPESPPVVVPLPKKASLERLFNTQLNTRLAISDDARLIGVAGDHLEVRSLDANGKPGDPIASVELAHTVLYLEVDNTEVRYSSNGGGRWRWRYRDGTKQERIEGVDGRWRGTTVAGDLLRIENRGLALQTVSGVQRWPDKNIEIAVISPDRRRVAYIEGGRFAGKIHVRDVTTGQVLSSERIDEPMALAWLGPTTLIYASSTLFAPTLYRVEVGTQLGERVVLHTQPAGWFSDLAYAGGNIYVVSMEPSPRGRVFQRRDGALGHKELDSVSLGIGWDAADRMVIWNRANLQLSSHAGKIEKEPANTTRFGDTLIATQRELGGRRAVASSLVTGIPVWRHDDKRTIAVRCAADREPPCFAVRYIDEDLDRIVTLDPATGALGDKAIYEARKIEDIAVRADGRQLLVTSGASLLEMSADGSKITKRDLIDTKGAGRLNLIRSVAYTKDGFVVAGTIGRNAYQVGQMKDGKYESLDYASDKILMLVRPSSDGSRVVYVARGYEPQLFRMHLP
jgi:serine/threonine protein kinase